MLFGSVHQGLSLGQSVRHLVGPQFVGQSACRLVGQSFGLPLFFLADPLVCWLASRFVGHSSVGCSISPLVGALVGG